ncbi:probable receptor-like protein kinase At2g23200 [Rutidosis leptorrhynchoides]|uniref:probable receptor-like protein kinase At2g23200 n=1 Tax=Rutidosis leptorrhynchoides TaxID=125765 RepID=UPI003A994D23
MTVERMTCSVDRLSLQTGKLGHLEIKLHDIELATENFAEKYCIGSGGYGMVYRAELEHFDNTNLISVEGKNKCELPKRRSIVAIKCILKRQDKQGEQGFTAEIETLSSCRHRNIVSLLDFCDEGHHMIIVYELASNGSLDDYLGTTDKMTNFTWVQRIKICLDIADGLNYIHSNLGDKQIIHRDMKSANILLNEKWEVMIADFGLSKGYQANQLASTINTNIIAGTQVYLDPEYEEFGRLKRASDVYSFGVILFEILFGRLAYDPIYIKENANGLTPVARRCFEHKIIYEMIDPKLKEENEESIFSKGLDQVSLDTFTKITYQCVVETQTKRPTMEIVIKELKKALYAQTDEFQYHIYNSAQLFGSVA